MRKFLAIVMCIFALSMNANTVKGVKVDFQVRMTDINHGTALPPYPRTPVKSPTVSLDGHTLFIYGDHEDYTLQLKAGDEVVYETVVPAGVSSVEFPSSYSGSYELHLHTTVFCFWGEISL